MPPQTPQITLAGARDYAYRAFIRGTDAAELHGDCQKPYDLPLRGVQSVLQKRLADWGESDELDYAAGYGLLGEFTPPDTRTVYVRVRCRKCEACLKHKRRLWTARAMDEVRWCTRSWFGTLTIGPERRFWAQAVADKRVHTTRNERFGDLTAIERTKVLASVLQPEVTRWLKRVRKQSGATLRYLLVVEPHADQFPHFHCLVHERGQPISKAILESQWKYGFSHWRLIPMGEVKQVGYVCKYITKSAQTRVRASRHYGQLTV